MTIRSEADRVAPSGTVEVRGVFVARPSVLGELQGRPVSSAIAKRRVEGPEIAVERLDLAGDQQADLTVHGGYDKAVYAYPVEHYDAWRAAGFDLEPGGVGENLAVAGMTEDDVRIGDVWRWGTAVLAVSQPRAPCFKLAMHVATRGAGPHMWKTGHCGWYLRVLETGVAPTAGAMERELTDEAEPTVAEAFRAMDPRAPDREALRRRVLTSTGLADQWREFLA
ncbi:MAG TPA: MOSC domain-containing protein [Aquihabitans sp.]|nr:MOSC domain-containing protein [Aquihabitans sp.]